MNKLKNLVKHTLGNNRGSAMIETMMLLSVVIVLAVFVVGFLKDGVDFNEILSAGEPVAAETEQTPQAKSPFSELESKTLTFLKEAGFMTTDEKRIAGSALLEEIGAFMSKPESAENPAMMDVLLKMEQNVETEMNYGI